MRRSRRSRTRPVLFARSAGRTALHGAVPCPRACSRRFRRPPGLTRRCRAWTRRCRRRRLRAGRLDAFEQPTAMSSLCA
jgi:hypothetical protein